jgi:ABC-type sugar transport system permease subunit
MMKFLQRRPSIERRNNRNGFLFCLPWCIGFLLFFFIPLIQSIAFSFSKVSVTTSGFDLEFVGLDNYYYILFQSPEYVDNLLDTLSTFGQQIPIIFVLSLIIAMILNSKFKGRTFFRSLYFIPVIIATGVVMRYLSSSAALQSMQGSEGDLETAYTGTMVNFQLFFEQMGIPESVSSMVFKYVNDIFNLIWQCGVHIILFISGLQSIPESLYEVSKVEGATKWEEFWFVTIPCLGNTIVLVIVYSVIEFCVSTSNAVIQQAYTVLQKQQIYHTSAAMLWLYFIIVAGMIGLIFYLFNRLCLKKWQ